MSEAAKQASQICHAHTLKHVHIFTIRKCTLYNKPSEAITTILCSIAMYLLMGIK